MPTIPDFTVHQPTLSDSVYKQILIVDDDPHGASLLKEGLASFADCQIRIANNSQQALQNLEAAKFDLLITDLQMPKMNGLMLVRQSRLIQPLLPIMMITGYSELISTTDAQTLAINYILDKPVKLATIRAVVRELLR